MALTLRAVAADHDRDPVRPWADRALWQVAGGVPLPFEVRVPAAEQRDDDLERLLEAREDVGFRQAERMRLPRPRMAGAEPEDVPPAADLVERLGRLGDD